VQFSTALSLQAADDRFGALHEWIDKHLGDHLPVVRNNSISVVGLPNTYKATRIGWDIASSICGRRGPR